MEVLGGHLRGQTADAAGQLKWRPCVQGTTRHCILVFSFTTIDFASSVSLAETKNCVSAAAMSLEQRRIPTSGRSGRTRIFLHLRHQVPNNMRQQCRIRSRWTPSSPAPLHQMQDCQRLIPKSPCSKPRFSNYAVFRTGSQSLSCPRYSPLKRPRASAIIRRNAFKGTHEMGLS